METPSPHACASCGAKCPNCRDGKYCAKATWCTWCANAYAENAPADDGRVYCAGCAAPFPSLAVLIERGLSRFPLYCKSCREERRIAAAAERELNARVGAESVVASNGDTPKRTRQRRAKAPPPEMRPMSTGEQVAAASREQAERDPDAHAVRGGFVPRPATTDPYADYSEMANGKTDWPGTRISGLYSGD